MIDFEQTYLHRRAVYRAIQKSQKSESEIAERIGKIAVKGKQELLHLFSAWLLEVTSANILPAAERTEIQSLTQMSLEKWIQLQAVAVQMKEDLKSAESKEKEAIAALQQKAPYGAATKLFAGTESKTQIQILQADVTAAQKHRETLAAALRQNVSKRQTLGGTFFQDCLTQLDKLAATQALGKEVTEIVERMKADINAAWTGHQKEQMEEFIQMAGLVDTLRVSYKDMPTALPQQDTPLSSPERDEKTQRSMPE